MNLYLNTKLKIKNIQRTIDGLLDGDFPLDAGKKALRKLREVFTELDKKLDRASKLKDEDSQKKLALNVKAKVYQSLPILGFILRSTNVRNAFELLDPLQQLADSLLQGRPQLLLSSEWNYVPFAYPQSIEDLRSFVLIGMPASEAASALLLPVAGHELGHAIWRNRGLSGPILSQIQEKCESKFGVGLEEFRRADPEYKPEDILARERLPEAIANAVQIAAFHAEELFCDMFAYALFGESYLYAFSYILAPGSGVSISTKHPSYKTRIDSLTKVAKSEGIALPSLESLGLFEHNLRTNPRDEFSRRIAAASVEDAINVLWSTLGELLTEAKIDRPNLSAAEKHYNEIQIGIPAERPTCLGDIVNAGWRHFIESQSTENATSPFLERYDYLNEVMLKSIEVLEFNRRTRHGT